jgi:Zn-dependent protease
MLSLLFDNPLIFVIWLAAILIALSAHEFSHALAGTLMGDDTAKRQGRLTLNPLSHVDPFGLFTLVAIGFGWGKPVPFNPYNLRNQRWGPVIVALAGPAMNLAIALVMGIILRVLVFRLGEGNLLIEFLFLSVYLNLSLLLFNLIPIPPLDGSKLLFAFLDGPSGARKREWLERRGPWLLLALILGDNILNLGIFSTLFGVITHFISFVVGV